MEALGIVDYKVTKTPSGYKCDICGVVGVKLWRRYQVFMEHQKLFCADCGVKNQERDYVVGEDGKHEEYGRRSDTIGRLVPAIPTKEGDSFWGFTSTPKVECEWWDRLPTRNQEPQMQ